MLGWFLASPSQAQTAKIVGIGASSCLVFDREIGVSPAIERDYVAWAQGFMSGALFRAPAGIDEGLDLAPPSFPLQEQAAFLRAFCGRYPEKDFMDAVRALYHRLRGDRS